ncbi:MAG: tRNA glutamyl-Q(34) synthetase GluQRS [Pseudomonadales bacterium]|jgi:glutamyl-Q tRNA(Asp) synthetase|nr:tRNA glutamyl-Q(34) synthetase GluQRS [Pseudomonadales bacterium]MDP7146845.1 tRNA glutamyl-Q(34) synthetase GluQRS [Pseudomonadales bacterium]MDP7359563.1 tRNA glutamyl-Q(34) synthetase GluQRS [Pseudomonadales bacterium]MDP7595836.1 tRNA glutamyl-Q(34) synthetase GluQRS [Pseudomonadales bacterium]HJN49932.1 tRNA glutamyl-Q(34) synthetase GluQRS [Pseudomonadales bacterium]|tara:strand:+ start:878 stop:1813 length:936 start_codon:yes stop_codon:yes gene_type:complete
MTDPTAAVYVGRFAPSPTGPLHFGSLVSALASYLDARSHGGVWLVRMEDLDPPRNSRKAADQILQALSDFGLTWDGEVLYQSRRLDSYASSLHTLAEENLLYACSCSRKKSGKIYPGFCRDKPQAKPLDADGAEKGTPHAMRVRVPDREITFTDLIQGDQRQHLSKQVGDFILKRKDGLFAYQLAVVVDDAYQQITHVVRGSDLLDSTPRQIYLHELLHSTPIRYAHHPVIANAQGNKLSKQTFATALDSRAPQRTLTAALEALNLNPPEPFLRSTSVDSILQWAIANWRLGAVPSRKTIPAKSIRYLPSE